MNCQSCRIAVIISQAELPVQEEKVCFGRDAFVTVWGPHPLLEMTLQHMPLFFFFGCAGSSLLRAGFL